MFVSHLETDESSTYSLDELTGCMPYIEKCVELCWFMHAQTPAMYLTFDDVGRSDIGMDHSKYDSASGKVKGVEFVLWPPLFRSKDGDLMSKGIVSTT